MGTRCSVDYKIEEKHEREADAISRPSFFEKTVNHRDDHRPIEKYIAD